MASTPILQNLTGLTFLLVAQSGIIVANFNRTTQREVMFVYDATVALDIGFVGHNPEAAYTVGGKRSGGSGLAAASPCVALTLADVIFGNGVGTDAEDAGTIFTQTVALSHSEKQFRELSITAFQKPGIIVDP